MAANRRVTIIVLLSLFFAITGCHRRPSDAVTEDYDEIDKNDPPQFVNNTRVKVVVAVSKTAILECRVRNLADRTVSWIRKRDLHILTMNKNVYTTDQRIHSLLTNSSGHVDWNLEISKAEVTDSGVYECQINTEPKMSKAYYLHVVVSKAQILGDRDVVVQKGSDINLVCRTQEAPEPPSKVVWLQNQVPIDALLNRGGISVVTESKRRSSNLLISKVTKYDAGNYTCVPTNALPDSVLVHIIDGANPKANIMASSSESCYICTSFYEPSRVVILLFLALAVLF